MRGLVFFCSVLASFHLYAESVFPVGCRPIPVQGDAVTIKMKKKLVFIHNLSKADLWITHPVTDPGASAGWASRLQPDNWSALAVSEPDFVINCIESRPGHEQQIPCEGAIAVCGWEKVKQPDSSQGTFWVDEDKSLPALTAAIGGKGYTVPVAQ